MALTSRETKALEIAEKFRITQNGNVWSVPSQYGAGKYTVQIVGKFGDCTCQDFETRREPCKRNEMYHYFMFRRDEFLTHYHKRSNVESTFSMIKRKFGDSLRSKTDVAMINEALCKILCHNLVVLIHEIHELGIAPTFWAETEAAQEPTR